MKYPNELLAVLLDGDVDVILKVGTQAINLA